MKTELIIVLFIVIVVLYEAGFIKLPPSLKVPRSTDDVFVIINDTIEHYQLFEFIDKQKEVIDTTVTEITEGINAPEVKIGN